jgi:hypothetical protein
MRAVAALVETRSRSGGINWDLLSVSFPEPILEAISSRRPVIAEPYMLPDPDDPEQIAEYEAWKEFFKDYVPREEITHTGEPATDIEYVRRPSGALLSALQPLITEIMFSSSPIAL